MHTPISTPSPKDILAHLQLNKATGLYFLDLDLSCDINGFQLATKIREYDSRAFIVIVTGDTKSYMGTFRHATEALDYITKDSLDFDERIKKCINTANDRYILNSTTPSAILTIKLAEDMKNTSRYLSKGHIITLFGTDIIYVESLITKPHHVCIFTHGDGEYVTRMTLKDVANQLGETFIQCNKSCIINIKMIFSVDSKNRILNIRNGHKVEIGRRQLKNVVSVINSIHKANSK